MPRSCPIGRANSAAPATRVVENVDVLLLLNVIHTTTLTALATPIDEVQAAQVSGQKIKQGWIMSD